MRVETTFAGAGVITGDLTPECAAVVTAVLDALAAPRGVQDTRTREQHYHDALQDAMRWRRKCIVAGVASVRLCLTAFAGLPDARSHTQLALRLRNRSVAVLPGVIEPALDPAGGEVGLVGGDQL